MNSRATLSMMQALMQALVLAVVVVGCSDPARSRPSESSSSLASSSSSTTSSPTAGSCEHDKKTFRCVQYVKNYDADTITFNIPGVHPLLGEKISVRVAGIDAPEVKTKDDCEKQSARTARRLTENVLKRASRIDLVNVDRDKYFRVLADVVVDGTNLKEVLMRNGLAYEYDGGTKRKVDWCAVAKGEARKPAEK